jgi:uncharacterized protein (DUF2235 family)
MVTAHNAVDDPPSRLRQIILACDGTNSTLTGGVHDTNVLKIIGQLAPGDDTRILYYDPGVGAPDQVPPLGLTNHVRRKWERLAGLASGRGIYENIAEAYLFLVDHYRPGDEIYIFGFSRGAFTARSVAGMVRLFGIIKSDSKSLILTLIRVFFSTSSDSKADLWGWQRLVFQWREKRAQQNREAAEKIGLWSPETPEETIKAYLVCTKERKSTREEIARQVQSQFVSAESARAAIHFIGVWDTVERVGIPGLTRSITSSGDTFDKKCFRHIRQAISMDEHRHAFAPRLYWDADYDEHEDDPARHRSLRQRWFRGVHSDVGGGYDKTEAGLSDQAYRWVLNEAIACGLQTEPNRALSEHRAKPFIAHDPCHTTPWWGVAGLTVRTNVTHYKNGRAQTLPVITEGTANDANARIYSVWHADLRIAHWQTLCALVLTVLLSGLYGAVGWAAMAGPAQPDFLARIWEGVGELERWKSMYFLELPLFQALGLPAPSPGPTLVAIMPAVWATLIDFGLIVAYSWLLGLYATWAFQAIVGRRHPQDKIPLLFKLGYAPMCVVVADVAENMLTLATLWCIHRDWTMASLGLGMFMMLATALKWLGVLGSVVLVACGIGVTAWKSMTQLAGWRTS